MTLRTKTFAAITGFAIIPLVFSFSVYLINHHINLDNSAIEERFIISKWIEMEFYPSVYRMRTEDLKIPEGIELCLINERGYVTYSNISLIPPGSYFSIIFPKFYESIKGRDSKSINESFIIDGKKWHFFLIYSQVPHVLEKEKFFILIKTLQFTFFIIAAGTILGSLFIGSILKSVNRLESAVKKIADGNLDFQLEVKGNDEFAALSASFEKMRETLKDDHARKSRFLMAVSHDLKTPLTSIKGYLEAISDGMASDAETQRKYLGIISEKASALEKRISDLIDFAGMETGEWQLKRKTVPLKAFLDSLSIIYREDCEILGRKFIYENTIPEEYEISCDPVLFERALENHFTNALRYTFDGAVISLRCLMEKDKPVIEIADNGKGIDEKDIKYIFEPFYRGSGSRREPGMGLGLSTSKSIFQSHGWEVSVAAPSEEGATGTVFRISLKEM